MKKRFLSLIIALAMMVGVFTPLIASADEATHKTDVVVHKIELKDLKDWPKNAGDEVNGVKYDGSQFGEDAFSKYFGSEAKELANVTFNYWKVTEEDYKVLDADHKTYNNTKTVEDKLKELVAARNEGKEEAEKEAVPTTKTAKTTSNGATIEGLENGYYWFVEDTDTVSRDGRTFAGAAAVPFGLTLPYAKADGTPFGQGKDALHVYPKNKLADKPEVDKDFKGKANPEKPRSAEEKNKPESHDAGDIIEYEIKTVFQPNTQYKTAFWTDQMTEGLTFNQDSIKVAVGDADLTADTDYKVDTTTNTFKVILTEEGLKKVNNQPEKVTVTVSYTATLNEKAKIDIPESNDVVFHYGNNPSQGNTPVPNKPKDKKMKVTKSWAEGTAPEGVTAKVALYDANTGEKVGDTITLPNNGSWEYEWTGLDDNKNYKVVEEGIDGYDAEYKKGEAGSLTITNHKTNNPKPLNPDEPKVVTHGKKFVKMEQGSDVRLKGAKFVIKNANGKFLGSTASQATEEKTAYEKAQEEYVKALNAYNEEVAKEKPTGLDTLKATLTEKKKDRDEKFTAYVKAQNKWVDTKEDAKVFESDDQGRFKVEGLAEGKDYKLVEIEAPKGYAEIKDEIKFAVGKGTYAGDKETEIQYNKEDTNDGYGLRVDNKKVTIPQTGGIGTIIFTAIGLAIMASAIIAIKKRQATEAR